MITSSGSEGITLKNTRFVHIIEPYWHPVRTDQVIGRARRICSHQDLPEQYKTVEVFMYLMTFTHEQLNGTVKNPETKERSKLLSLTLLNYLKEIEVKKIKIKYLLVMKHYMKYQCEKNAFQIVF